MDDSNETSQNQSVKLVVKDPAWNTDKFQIISIDSQSGNSMLQVNEGKVSGDGHCQSGTTNFKVYQGSRDKYSPHLMMFECLGGNSSGYMLSVDKKTGQLSCMKKVKHYVNVFDAEEEVQFTRDIPNKDDSGSFRLRVPFNYGWVGFHKSGKPMDPAMVNPEKHEAFLMLTPSHIS